ncbi:Gamma-aminobutyric acid receptor subunit like protein [Argiope bruennichi]|uniref:Gamma-aminobutyric acid receptor subunit like protein n=1 Tax=Argiope bruennichi TaxID=94029 RepID=A0A8T0F1Z5_ARGBR|nr:Gamma-aminobutyric acid receptor subunit like protein [Argiope bruennichi]KAF8784329.1 Gamma-aminobutyric acid receptor subunit like protein [Argiope bruennichi]
MPCRQSVWRSNPLSSLSSQLRYDLFMPFNWLIAAAFFTLGVQSNELQKLSNTTYLLDTLLSEDNYDRQIRPGIGGPPITIQTDIEIRSFGPISESERVYSMDCYFRQTWFDSRLKFFSHKDVLSMDWKFLQKVWIPDTYFLNGKSSYLHKITVPNKFIRLRKDGQLKYSMRLTVKASCPMHLRKYPLDTQACPLEIGSYAYPSQDVLYSWNGDKAVELSKDVVLSQYDFVNISQSNRTNTVKVGGREDHRSILVVYFVIQRRRGYFILQIYAPCAMIVGASWVSFWINRSDAAGRVAVGATTVLTMVTMGFGGRGREKVGSATAIDWSHNCVDNGATTVLTMVTMGFGGRGREKVGSATAIDWFVIMCFTFVFAALVEYAFVNFIDNYEKQQIKRQMELDREKKKKEEAIGTIAEPPDAQQPSSSFGSVRFQEVSEKATHAKNNGESLRQQQMQLQQLMQGQRLTSLRRRPFTSGRLSLEKSAYRNRHIASKVDSYARVLFPVTFLLLNVMYWTLFLLVMDDEIVVSTHPEYSSA